jgi:hypothetical protein
MAITNYGELKTALANWLHRTDLSARLPEFVTLAQVRISDDVRANANTVSASGTSTDKTIPLPADFIEGRSLHLSINGTNRPLDYLTPAQYAHLAQPTGDADAYTIIGSSILLARNPSGNQSYTLVYYAKETALSADSDTTTLLSTRPGLYLYGTLCEAAPYLRDADTLALWEQKYAHEVQWVNGSVSGHSNMRIRADQGV